MPYYLSYIIIIITLVLFSFSVHELAHAWVANRFGDSTAKLDGRISLNPIAHWDPIGTTMLVILLILGLPAFGWGKPVPINPRNFKNPRRDLLISSLAGPISNILLAILFALVLHFFFTSTSIFSELIIIAVTLNIYLAIFNLIPLPPLDGSEILHALLPESAYEKIEANSTAYLIALIILITIFPGIISSLVQTIVNFIV